MDWSKGYSARYYMTEVDRATWRDLKRIEITDGNIERTTDELLQSADIECVDYDGSKERLIRVWLDARQESEGGDSHTPLFTGLATSPSKDINGTLVKNSVQCYSVLKIAQDMLLERGWYAPIDIDAAIIVKNLLSVTGAPFDVAKMVDGQPMSAKLEYAIIAEDNENRLSMAWKIADAVGWIIGLLGDGTITFGPRNESSKWTFGATVNDIIEPSITIENDWYSCPNVLRVSANGLSAIARDDSIYSDYSVPNRGREIWEEESDADLPQNTSLAEYARKRLKDLQGVAVKVNYDRRFHPDLYVGDIITLNYPKQGLVGTYIINSQSITLGYNATTSEEVYKVWESAS